MNFSDEAYFHLTESVNKQNNRMWLKERPVDWIEKPLNDAKVLVWCAISAKKIYGPYFFETTVNQHIYINMLKTFFGRSTSGQLITRNITFNKMELLHIPLQWFKTGSSQKTGINLWTRKSGPLGHQTSILATTICEAI